jgi:hypothetical protein
MTFSQTCGRFFDDPEAYLADLPEQGSQGQSLSATSADGAFTVSEYQNGLFHENMHVARFGDHAWITCHILVTSVSDKSVDEQERLFRSAVSQSPDAIMAGGKVERNYTMQYAGALEISTAEIAQFTVAGVLERSGLYAEVELDGEGFYAFVSGRVPLDQ